MINHHDILLPNFISAFASVKIIFPINLVQSKSGREIRTLETNHLHKKYLIENCKLSSLQFEEFNNFFIGRRGMMYSFRFTDYADCSASNQYLQKITNQPNQYNLQKIYNDPVHPYRRLITLPKKNTVTIFRNNKPVEAQINYASGVIAINQVVAETDVLTASFRFDVLVRFNQNNFEYFYSDDGSIELKNIELVEVVE